MTGIFLVVLFSLLFTSVSHNVFELQSGYGHKFREYHQMFDYYIHYLLPLLAHITIVYAAFLFVNMLIVPVFLERQRWLTGIALALLTMVTVFLVLMVAYSYYYGYLLAVYDTVKGAHMHFAKSAFITTIFYAIIYVLYYFARHIYFQYFRTGKVRPNQLAIIAVTWGLLLVSAINTGSGFVSLLVLIWVPQYAAVFLVCQKWIFPRYQKVHRNKRILWRDTALISVGTGLPAFLLFVSLKYLSKSDLLSLLIVVMVIEVMVLLTAWWLHIRANTMLDLQKALGRSTADLDLLRAQINPHFLFNALNTLYGTALQENAPNTGEGIQRLGDMMRFMLHENHQEKIPLTREIAYLHNYISLQRLRTQVSPDIQISVSIDENRCEHDIAPMLLIPFVENAFKHGISLRNRSAITVSLSCDETKIYFDVYNTVHERPEPVTEKEGNGIGLTNVQQRLVLIYPQRHELDIRRTAAGFFIHLTIDVGR